VQGFIPQEGMSIKTFKRDLPKSHTVLYRKRPFIALTVCYSKEDEGCLVGWSGRKVRGQNGRGGLKEEKRLTKSIFNRAKGWNPEERI